MGNLIIEIQLQHQLEMHLFGFHKCRKRATSCTVTTLHTQSFLRLLFPKEEYYHPEFRHRFCHYKCQEQSSTSLQVEVQA